MNWIKTSFSRTLIQKFPRNKILDKTRKRCENDITTIVFNKRIDREKIVCGLRSVHDIIECELGFGCEEMSFTSVLNVQTLTIGNMDLDCASILRVQGKILHIICDVVGCT